jgi:hypothetical protein
MSTDILKEIIHYDKENGEFKWIVKKNGMKESVGTINSDGYRCIGISGKIYKAHRLAWLYVYGELPNGVIDHINGDKLDNRISNLRDVSCKVNSQNMRKSKNNNSILTIPGVYQEKRSSKYRVKLNINGEQRHFGNYETKEEAEAVCIEMRRKYYIGNKI